MRIVPRNIDDKIRFCEGHLAQWAVVPDSIGTSAAAVAELQAKTVAARAALLIQGQKQQEARSATSDLHAAVEAMADAVAEILKQIKARAAGSGEGIYPLARIPAPALPSPRPAPGKPYALRITLEDCGILHLKWKCDNPAGTSGTMYQVWRRIDTGSEFAYLGGNGKKSFIDATLPAGAAQVTYQIQAVRSTATGPIAQFNVNFGISAGGAVTARVAPRAAA